MPDPLPDQRARSARLSDREKAGFNEQRAPLVQRAGTDMKECDVSASRERVFRKGRRARRLSSLGSITVVAALFSGAAGASLATLSPGHAYCYYFSGPGRYGGMHLVAAGPSVIAKGPSNYESGVGGKPQDTVFYVDCLPGRGRIGGEAYVGLPRIVLHLVGGSYAFDRHFSIPGIRHLGTTSRARMKVTMHISGTLAEGVINGTVHLTAPGCLPRPLVMSYKGV